jgi:hypothetical protein
VGKETPNFDRSPKQEGHQANHGDDPTLASYVSSLVWLLSVPTLLAIAYAGYVSGFYGYRGMVPAFAGLLVLLLVVVFSVMHVLTGR